MPISPALAEVLRDWGHEAVHASTIGLARASDETLLALAYREQRVVVTADMDFPRMLALTAAAGPGVILFRGGSYSEAEMRDLLRRVFDAVAPEAIERSICVVDKARLRLTPLPLRTSDDQ